MMKTTSKEIAEGLSNITTEFSKTLSSFDIQTTTEILEMLVGVSFSDLEIDEVSSVCVCVCVCVRACARAYVRPRSCLLWYYCDDQRWIILG